MEADQLHGLSPRETYKMKIHQPLISRPYDIYLPSNIPSMGLVQPPLLLSPRPPLLPLPATYHRRSSASRGPSCSPTANRNGKKLTKSPKKEEKRTPKRYSNTSVVSSTSTLGITDRKELPKNILKVCHDDVYCINGDPSTGVVKDVEDHQVDRLLPSNSVVFTVSPPPSSLPLPSFSLRPKLISLNAVAAGIDAAATDNLRRFLRLN